MVALVKQKVSDKVYNKIKDIPDLKSAPGIFSFINEEIDEAVQFSLPAEYSNTKGFTVEKFFSTRTFAEVNLKPKPGFEAKLSNEQISNNPSETLTYFEVTNGDRLTIQTYNKMDNDPILSLGKIVLSGMIGSLRYTLDCEDKVIEEVVKLGYRNFHNYIVSEIVTIGRKLGFAFAEKTFKKQYASIYINTDGGDKELAYEGEITALNEVKFINPEQDITYWIDKKTDKLAYVEQTVSGNVRKCQRNKLIWAALDSEFGNIFGDSSYRRAYPFWYYDKINYQLMFKHLERSGSPHLEARYPTGNQYTDTDEEIGNDQVMKNIVVGLFSNGAAFLPHDIDEKGNQKWTVEFKEAKNQTPEPYLKFASLSDSKKLQAIYVPEASLMNSSFSETDAKIDILMIIAEHLVNQIQKIIKQDVINQLVEYNFGPEYIDKVDFKIDRTGLGRRSLLKEIYLQAMRVGNNVKGYQIKNWIDFKKALEELGMPVASFDQNFFESMSADSSVDLENQQENMEDTNGDNRTTEDNRERDRQSKTKNVTDSTK